MAAPRVLHPHANSEDHLADSILHGLWEALGAGVLLTAVLTEVGVWP
jgi:hypothetical protein